MILKNITLKLAICSVTLTMSNTASASDWWCCCGDEDKEAEPSPRQRLLDHSHKPPTSLTMDTSSRGASGKKDDHIVVDLRAALTEQLTTTPVQTDEDPFGERKLVTINMKKITESDRSGASQYQLKLLNKQNISGFSVGLWEILATDDARTAALGAAISNISDEGVSLDVFIPSYSDTMCRLDLAKDGKQLRSVPISF